MEIIGFYGVSGTGKSSRALTLADELGAAAIIDDGLLIMNGQRIAGTSAKFETRRVSAIKRAIFHEPAHAAEVRGAIDDRAIDRLLILGTSRAMIDSITRALALPAPHAWIAIESVAAPQEIRGALFARQTEGKHVIPIPRIDVEKRLLARWIGKVQSVLSPDRSRRLGETTIVYPRFQLGRVHIREQCLEDIVRASCRTVPGLSRIDKMDAGEGALDITLFITVHYGAIVHETARAVQLAAGEALEQMLSWLPRRPCVVVHRLAHPKPQARS